MNYDEILLYMDNLLWNYFVVKSDEFHFEVNLCLSFPWDSISIFHLYMDFVSVQTGSGSTTRKKSLIVHLMCSCREKEMKFLVRTLV